MNDRHGLPSLESDSDRYAGDDSQEGAAPRLRVRTFRAGARLLGILEDEIASVAPWQTPAPLPNAPPPVLGVVSMQGRMLTVLDPQALFDASHSHHKSPGSSIVALRGDEQLALVVDECVGAVDAGESALHDNPEAIGIVRGVLQKDGETIYVVQTTELFSSAMRGRERRRRRF